MNEAVFKGLRLSRFSDKIETREDQILLAAIQCIAEIGIAGTSTHAVARRAKINQGSIHYYFRSKNELLRAVLDRLMKHSTEIIKTIRRSKLTPTQKAYCLLYSGSNFIQQRDEVIALISLWAHAVAKQGEWRTTYRQQFKLMRREVVAIVNEGINQGEFRIANPKIGAETILMAIQGIGMHYLMSPADFEDQPLVGRMVGLFFPILGVDSDNYP